MISQGWAERRELEESEQGVKEKGEERSVTNNKKRKNKGISQQRSIYRSLGGHIPKPTAVTNLDIPIEMTLLSWNINGLCASNPVTMEKLATLKNAVLRWKPNFITLQETHGRRELPEILRAEIPYYIWVVSPDHNGYRGVAIGVRHDRRTVHPLQPAESDPLGRWIIQPLRFKKERIILVSIYKPDKTPRSFWSALCERFKGRIAIVGGDFNARPDSNEMSDIMEQLASQHISIVPSKLPTHASSHQIDYIGYHDALTKLASPFLEVCPTPRDHGIIITGLKWEKEKAHLPMPRIPEELAGNQDFVDQVIESALPFDDSPYDCFQRVKAMAHDKYKEWRANPPKKDQETIKDLGQLLRAMSVLRVKRGLPAAWLSKEPLKSIVDKVRSSQGPGSHISKTFCEIKREISRRARLHKINIPSLKIFTKDYKPKRPFRDNAIIATVTNDRGEPIRDVDERARELSGFWGKIFGTKRLWSPSTIDKMVREHGGSVDQSFDIITDDEIMECIKENKHTAAGPDGVPFIFYKTAGAKLLPLWNGLIKWMAEGKHIESKFVAGNLVLLAKSHGRVRPDKFRPITIANADYRLAMSMWGKKLAKAINPWICKSQRALLEGRYIKECIDPIYDTYAQWKREEKKGVFLQTDFAKAFDYLNRDALIHIMKRIKVPKPIRNAMKIALSDAPIYLIQPGTTPCEIQSVTGTKQGCPASPLIFIIAMDLMLRKIERCKDVYMVKAYMDDMGVLVEEGKNLNAIWKIIKEYESAVGSQLSVEKCTRMETVKGACTGSGAQWALAPIVDKSTYLGIVIANAGRVGHT